MRNFIIPVTVKKEVSGVEEECTQEAVGEGDETGATPLGPSGASMSMCTPVTLGELGNNDVVVRAPDITADKARMNKHSVKEGGVLVPDSSLSLPAPSPSRQQQQQQQQHQQRPSRLRRVIGSKVRKVFTTEGTSRWFEGKVVSSRDDVIWGELFTVQYEDDDSEELTRDEVELILLSEEGGGGGEGRGQGGGGGGGRGGSRGRGRGGEEATVRVREATMWAEAAKHLDGPTTITNTVGVLSRNIPIVNPERVPGCGGIAHAKLVFTGFVDVECDEGGMYRHVFQHHFADVAGAAAAHDILVRRVGDPKMRVNYPANTPMEVLAAKLHATAVPPPSAVVNDEVVEAAAAEARAVAEEEKRARERRPRVKNMMAEKAAAEAKAQAEAEKVEKAETAKVAAEAKSKSKVEKVEARVEAAKAMAAVAKAAAAVEKMKKERDTAAERPSPASGKKRKAPSPPIITKQTVRRTKSSLPKKVSKSSIQPHVEPKKKQVKRAKKKVVPPLRALPAPPPLLPAQDMDSLDSLLGGRVTGAGQLTAEMGDIHSALKQANEMLQSGLINSADYDALKVAILRKVLG